MYYTVLELGAYSYLRYAGQTYSSKLRMGVLRVFAGWVLRCLGPDGARICGRLNNYHELIEAPALSAGSYTRA